ncbi:MAG: hypothetical protein FWH05_06015 [Oscillospiraceae bacterium]|nr:hypothetical protein [Oscillospiraceae bacterium]
MKKPNFNFDLETLKGVMPENFRIIRETKKIDDSNVEVFKFYHVYTVLNNTCKISNTKTNREENSVFLKPPYVDALFKAVRATKHDKFTINNSGALNFSLKISQNCKKGKGENCSDCGCLAKPCENDFPTECNCLNLNGDEYHFMQKKCLESTFSGSMTRRTFHDSAWLNYGDTLETGFLSAVCKKHKSLKFFIIMYPFLRCIDNGEENAFDEKKVTDYLNLLVKCKIIENYQKESIINHWKVFFNNFFLKDENLNENNKIVYYLEEFYNAMTH